MKIAAIVFATIAGTLGLSSWHAARQSHTQANPSHSLAVYATAGDAESADPESVIPEPGDAGKIRVPGQVQPKNKVAIRAAASLPVMELPFGEGDRVTKGGAQGSPASVLARLDVADLKAALRAAEAKRDAQAAEIEAGKVRLKALESQIASSRVCLGEAERNWARYKQIVNRDSVSETEIDEAHCKYDRLKAENEATLRGYEVSQATLKVAQENLKAAEAELEQAQLALANATITSPIDGVVTRVNVNVGEVVTGTITNPGTVLMEVADMDRMLLVSRVDEESIGKVKVGQLATVRLKGYNGEVFTGTVENVALTSTDEKDGTRYFKTEISLDTEGRVVPAGLTGEARIAFAAEGVSRSTIPD